MRGTRGAGAANLTAPAHGYPSRLTFEKVGFPGLDRPASCWKSRGRGDIECNRRTTSQRPVGRRAVVSAGFRAPGAGS